MGVKCDQTDSNDADDAEDDDDTRLFLGPISLGDLGEFPRDDGSVNGRHFVGYSGVLWLALKPRNKYGRSDN